MISQPIFTKPSQQVINNQPISSHIHRMTFTNLTCLNYTQIQKLKLKSSFISCSLPKPQLQFCTTFYFDKINKKYQNILDNLIKKVDGIKSYFTIAQANQIKVIDNVMRNYLKRVGMIENQVGLLFKHDKFDLQQKWIMEKLILDPFSTPSHQDFQKANQIYQNIQKITESTQHALKQNQSLPQFFLEPKSILHILNECQIHLNSKFHQFQSRFVSVEKVILDAVDSLHDYWNKFEEIACKKVMEVKSTKEKQLQTIIKTSQEKPMHPFSHLIHAQNSNLMQNTKPKNISHHNNLFSQNLSHEPHFIPHNILSFSNSQTLEPKPISNLKIKNKLGQMSNKKKGKVSILQSGEKKPMQLITARYFGMENDEMEISFEEMRKISDAWTDFYRKQKNDETDKLQYQQLRQHYCGKKRANHLSQLQIFPSSNNKYHAQDSLTSIMNRTYPSFPDLQQSRYYYDQYGKNKNFSLQHPLSSLIQSRLQFESWHYSILELQFTKISQRIIEKQKKVNQILQQLQKSKKVVVEECKIGFINVNNRLQEEKKNLQRLISEGFDQEFLPQVILWDNVDQNDENLKESSYETTQIKQLDRNTVLENLSRFSTATSKLIQENGKLQKKSKIQLINKSESIQPDQKVAFSSSTGINHHNNPLQNHSQTNNMISVNNQIKNQLIHQNSSHKPSPLPQQPQHPPTLLSSLIQSFFTTIQTKYCRLAKQQKTLKTFYFRNTQTLSSSNSIIPSNLQTVQRIFIVLQQPQILLIRMQKLYHSQRQVIKCTVYNFGSQGVMILRENEKDMIRKCIISLFDQQLFTVTISFRLISDNNTSIKADSSPSKSQKQPSTTITTSKPRLLSQLPCNDLPSVQLLTGILTVMIYQQKLQSSHYQFSDYLSKGQQLIKQYQMYFLQDIQQQQLQHYNEFIKYDTNYYQKLAKINYLFDLKANSSLEEEGIVFENLSKVIKREEPEKEEIQIFMVKRANNRKRKGKFYQKDDDNGQQVESGEQDQDQDDDNYAASLFNSKNSNNNNILPPATSKSNKQQASQPNHPPLSSQPKQNIKDNNEQQNPQELITYNDKLFTTIQNQQVLKRSNSRQQLKHITTTSGLVFYEISQVEKRQQEKDYQQQNIQEEEGQIDQHDYNDDENAIDQQYSDYQITIDDEDQEYVGLQ